MAWWDKLGQGIKLERPAQLWPVGVAQNMFIAHGKILLSSIIGEVEVDAIGGTCGDCSLTTETIDIATAVAIGGDPVGQRYGIDTIGGALLVAPPFTDLHNPIIIPDGADISITITANPTDDGQIKWTIRYQPMEAGAYVALA